MELPFNDHGKRKRKMAEPSSSLSPARTIDKRSFDVFLSFRGEDTRKGFTSHLYNALRQRGISTFIDSEELERGERIEELFNYIEASKIFVPVLSEGYADSRWCMREITKMVEDVRKQSGPFEAAFQKHESGKRVGEEDLKKWKDALEAVGKMSGYSFQNDTDENEAQFIGKVVQQISLKLNKTARPVTEHLVGMDFHIDKMNRLLDLTDNEVKMIGIVGMGGIGKTTIATVVYNKLHSEFKDSSFISNVRENFKHHNGGVALQQRLIKDILKDEHPDVADVERGASLFEERFRSKKVLIILDDVDNIEQLEALAGKTYWFGSESRIIITSRDSRVLLNHGVKEEHIYKPEPLDDENSFKLFESHAFHGVQPTKSEYSGLSMKFVEMTGGLPLALTVFGSLLLGRNIKQWKEHLQKLIQIPNTDVHGRLRISYDGLEKNVKQIFLDISCFLIGEHKKYAIYMWEDCGLYPEIAIAELQERSLISINKDDEFEMHDLLRDMGRGIAQQGEHWRWSRLRNLDDLLQSLAYKDKPRMANGIVMEADYTPANGSETYLNTKHFVDFSPFSLLRLLHLSGFAFKDELLLLPKRLKWLRLSDCMLLNGLFGPSNLNAISVLELIHVDDVDPIQTMLGRLMELSSSSIKKKITNNFSFPPQAFDALKVLHLEHFGMTKTPVFSKMKMICLQKLTLQNCRMITEVDGSIGSLKSLVHLNLRHCDELQKLPDSICTLMSLKTLILIHCKSLSSLPEKLGDMKSLKMLRVEHTGIHVIPDSIGDLSNLHTLSLLANFELKKLPDSMRMLDSLKELYTDHFEVVFGYDFGEYNLLNFDSVLNFVSEYSTIYFGNFGWLAVIPNSACEKVIELKIRDLIEELPPYLGRLTNLEALSLSCRELRSLPEWLGQFQKLKFFELESNSLEALPASAGRMFENLRFLKLECPTLKHVLDLSLTQTVTDSALFFLSNHAQLQELRLEFCENLESLPRLPSSLNVLDARGCNNLRTISDVSNLKSLRELILGGCRLLEDFCGLESIAHNLETLELPGPWGGLSGFSQLSPAFMTRIFKVRCNFSKSC
ncbi:Disease resistance protein [Nymphaea thermarum]|nr:Disease resistance protein [Nymphaea thermarum]